AQHREVRQRRRVRRAPRGGRVRGRHRRATHLRRRVHRPRDEARPRMTTIVVALAGASGSVYARRLLALLGGLRTGTLPGVPPRPDLDVHWVATANAALVWESELGVAMPETFPGVRRWASHDFSAPFASGSNAPDAVIVAPCSMSTLARVA